MTARSVRFSRPTVSMDKSFTVNSNCLKYHANANVFEDQQCQSTCECTPYEVKWDEWDMDFKAPAVTVIFDFQGVVSERAGCR
jgi:hypothetical protein